MKTKRLKIMKKHTLPLVCIPVAALTLAGCSLFGMGETQPATQQTSESTKETQTETTEITETKETQTTEETRTTKAEADAEKTQTKLSLIAAGDNLIHDTVYEKFEEAPGEYDFTPMYSHIKDLVQSHDIAVINQETIFVENDSEIGSYPDFGTPHEMGDALVDTGFDVVLSATNHTMDKGTDTIYNMVDYWERKYPDIKLLGIHESRKDADTLDLVEKNGIRLAMFNYTY